MGDAADALAATRVVLRPIGTPLPISFIGLTVATVAFSALQLGWIAPDQGRVVALAALVLTVPLQLGGAVFGLLARDPVAGTGMALLGGSWAVTGVVTLTTPPGSHSAGLGVVLRTVSVALLVPVTAASTKLVAAAVMGIAAVRFGLTGIAELTAAPAWEVAAGIGGLVLGVVALYAALAFELEDARHRTVLPLLRRGAGSTALSGDLSGQVAGVVQEAGVREQL